MQILMAYFFTSSRRHETLLSIICVHIAWLRSWIQNYCEPAASRNQVQCPKWPLLPPYTGNVSLQVLFTCNGTDTSTMWISLTVVHSTHLKMSIHPSLFSSHLEVLESFLVILTVSKEWKMSASKFSLIPTNKIYSGALI